jgi:hypothetical protein
MSETPTLPEPGSYWGVERASLVRRAELDQDRVDQLKAEIAEIRKAQRAKLRQVAEIDAQARYEAYVGCLTCFPFRDWEASRALGGEHTCGLTARERLDVYRKNFESKAQRRERLARESEQS